MQTSPFGRFVSKLSHFLFETSYVSWFILVVSVAVISAVTPMSLTEKATTIKNEGLGSIPKVEFTSNVTQITNEFVDVVRSANQTLDIVISLPPTFMDPPPIWNSSIGEALNRGVQVRIYTNNLSLPHPSRASMRVFPYINVAFSANFAVADSVNSIIPSSFFPTRNQTAVSYYITFNPCPGVGQDLEAIFDFLWNIKTNESAPVIKKQWLGGSGFELNHSSKYVFPLFSSFSLNRPNFTEFIRLTLDDSSDDKMIITDELFRKRPTTYSDAVEGGIILGLLQISSITRQYFGIYAGNSNFENHIEEFRSISTSLNDGEIHACDVTIEMTAVAADDALVLFPSSFHTVYFDGSFVLGFSAARQNSIANLRALMGNISSCKALNVPNVTVAALTR